MAADVTCSTDDKDLQELLPPGALSLLPDKEDPVADDSSVNLEEIVHKWAR